MRSPHALRMMPRVVLVAVLLLASSCQSNPETRSIAFDNLNLHPIIEQDLNERSWPADVLGRKVIHLPAGTDQPPVVPAIVFADQNEFFYVVDGADGTFKQFDSAGNFVMSFGEGQGEGPGEATTMFSYGVLGDSALWFLDMSQRINYFRMDGSFARSERLIRPWHNPMTSLAITAEGRHYYKVSSGQDTGYFFETSLSGTTKQFGALQHESGWEEDLPLFGKVAAHRESMLYIPSHFPFIARFSADGALEYARATMDYGITPKPEYVHYAVGRKRVFNEPLMKSVPSVDGDRLFVHAYAAQAIDVYDVNSGDYLYSVRLPEVDWAYVMNERLYWIDDDEGVSVWAMPYVR